MKVSISEIKVRDGRRKVHEGRAAEIAQSIADVGLLNPITITQDYTLIAGAHRLEACKRLGWKEIEATIIDATGLMAELAEIDENLMRNDLTEMERALQIAKRKRIYEDLYPDTKHGGDRKSDQVANLGNLIPRFTTTTAEITGESERTIYRQVKRGEELAKTPELVERLENIPQIADSGSALDELIATPPEKRDALLSVIEEGKAKSLQEAKREIKLAERQERIEIRRAALGSRIEDINAIEKQYRIIYADPPWRYREENHGSVGEVHMSPLETHYPTLSISELCALPITQIAENNAVLFLWVTSPLLEEAFDVIRAWGFKYKTSMVWDKVRHNVGNYVSVRHELLLICTRGACTPDNRKLHDSVQVIERTGHSQKPEEFRAIIDEIYPYGQRIELFRRGSAPDGWDVWGNEA